jgi:hypothetical protein
MTHVPDEPGQEPEPEVTTIDWFDSEPAMSRMVIDDLQRLKYRAKARIIPILLIAVALTAGLVYKLGQRVPQHRATVILALQEGVQHRDTPMPMRDLRAYVTTVLMPTPELTKLIEKRNLFPLRKKMGPEFAIGELWDMMEIEIYRNYFLYDTDVMSAARSARIGITIVYSDPDEAYEIARDIGTIVIRAAGGERDRAATVMADEASRATLAARRRTAELEAELAMLTSQQAEAEASGHPGTASALRVEIAAVESSVKRAKESLSALAKSSSASELTAAVYSAGLSLDVSIVEERKPEAVVPGKYRIAVITVVVFLAVLVVVALFLGAFDSRVHDLDDVARLGIPVVGQVPGFPGDGVGSLRERGVTRKGVTLSWR